MDTVRTPAENNVRTASGLNILAGVWLVIAPFVLGYSNLEEAMWNDVIVGAVVIILAAIRVANPLRNPGLSWVNVVLGIWLIIAPFVLGYSEIAEPVWNDVILGIIIAGLAAWSAWATGSLRPTSTMAP